MIRDRSATSGHWWGLRMGRMKTYTRRHHQRAQALGPGSARTVTPPQITTAQRESSSPRCATLTITPWVRPLGLSSGESSVAPCRQLAKVGDASRVWSARPASASDWQNLQLSAPTESMGGWPGRPAARPASALWRPQEKASRRARKQHVLAALGRVGIATQEAQHQRDGGAQRGPGRLGVRVPALGAPRQRREHVQKLAGRGAGGVIMRRSLPAL